MFNEIGPKLKSLAHIILWLGVIGSVILAIVFFSSEVPGTSLTGWIVLICGCFGSWFSGCICYGVGTAAENNVEPLQESVANLRLQIDNLQKAMNKRMNNQESFRGGEAVPEHRTVLNTTPEDFVWRDDGPLYKVCPQCHRSISVQYLENNKSCMHCGCAYHPEKKS